MNFFEKINDIDDSVFCPLPFIHMYVHSSETEHPCCVFQKTTNHILNTTPNKSRNLKKEWNSEFYQNIRQHIISGEKISGCKECYYTEKSGSDSDRIAAIRRYKKILKDNPELQDITLDSVKGNSLGTPWELDLRPGNLCNLQCRMCGPASSSQLNKEYEKLGLPTFNESLEAQWMNDDNLEFLLRHSDKGKKIKFLGGEPTIMPGVLNIIDKLIEQNKTDNRLHFTSNLTNVNKNFLDRIKKFSNLSISISMDGIGDTLEYIRYPVKWEQLRKNIKTYVDLEGVRTIDISFTIQAYNITNILNTCEWLEEFNKTNDCEIYLRPKVLTYPKYLSYRVLPKKFRDHYLRSVLNYTSTKNKHIYHIPKIEQILDDTVETDRTEFIQNTVLFDISRNQSIKDYIPEIYDIIKNDYVRKYNERRT
jgi:hypothetical protein